MVDIAVGHQDGHLAGFGSLLHKDSMGELCQFGVRSSDRGVGIGKAIIDERLRIAAQLGVATLEMPYLEPTNTLRAYYLEAGFSELESGGLVLGTDSMVFRDELIKLGFERDEL